MRLRAGLALLWLAGCSDSSPTTVVEVDAPPGCRIEPLIPEGCTSTTACRQIERWLGSKECIREGYLEYTPPGYGDGVPRPLLIFLHGIAQSGDGTTDLDNITVAGPPNLIAVDQWPLDRDFIVLSPQHVAPRFNSCHSEEEVHDFIDYAIQAYDVDTSRIYLTGLSCGGISIWQYLAKYRDSQGVAGVVPIAADGRVAWDIARCELGRVPIWAFHNDGDPDVSPAGAIEPITNLLTRCDPVPDVQMTIYDSDSHNAWANTYNLQAGNDIYSWMLARQR